jgi:hypothetical protein
MAQPEGGDAAALCAFVRAVIERGIQQAGDGRLSDNSVGARVVCRNGRLIEVRLESGTAYRLLGGGETAQTLVRAWAARRWVKQVRPVFVLERRALETLDDDLRRAVLAAALPAP